MTCAVKAFKGAPFSASLRGYHNLRLLSSHPSVPRAFSVVNRLTPKLYMSTYKETHVHLCNYIFDSKEKLSEFAVSFMQAVAPLQERKILHNNRNPSNVFN